MRNSLKFSLFLYFALSLTLFLTDSNIIGDVFSCYHFDCETASSDSSKQCNISHSVCFEDVLFLKDSKIKQLEFAGKLLLPQTSTINFTSNYSTSIWQPPKHA